MKMSMKTTGFGRVQGMLRSVGKKVPEAARKQMHRAAARVVKAARLYVPEDTTALRESIRIEKAYGYHGRLQINIVAGDAIGYADGKEIDVSAYAFLVHENYSSMKPGKGTLQKMAANPDVTIGEGFLYRALDEENQKLEKVLVAIIERAIDLETRVK